MTMPNFTITVGGKRWTWRWHHFGRGDSDGACDQPNTPRKELRIRHTLQKPERQRRLLEVAIHEALHALMWHLDEDTVTSGAEDIADLLWKLGYRRIVK